MTINPNEYLVDVAQLLETLEREGGILSFNRELPGIAQTPEGRDVQTQGSWTLGTTYGMDTGSPAAAYGVGVTIEQALEVILDRMGLESKAAQA